MSNAARLGTGALVLLIVLCGLTLIAGFLNKDRCSGPSFDSQGRSEPELSRRHTGEFCYSDIAFLWVGRDINNHVFPYIHGRLDEKNMPVGGVVEYPVLTGVLIWAGAILATNDAQFLFFSGLLLAPFGLLIAWQLGRLSRWRALLWALGPPLILYAFHNWDLPVVATAVAAVYVMHRGWGRAGVHRPLMHRAIVAAVLLGLGFALKLYPALFVLPLMFYVFTGGRGGLELPAGKRYDTRGALRVAGVAAGTVVLANLPFAVLGFEGWKASFVFQGLRRADVTTNSIWYWGFRPGSDNPGTQTLISVLSPTLMVISFAVACLIGWRRYKREGTYPWIAVSAAMLCGFLLLHKVHSPQYTLWILPMFVLMNIRWGWIAAYLFADIAMGIGIFVYYEAGIFGKPDGIQDGLAAQAVVVGVWGRAALLIGLFFAFLAARSTVDEEADGEPADQVASRPA
nr:glycosyltransferase 87 family protein [Herbihabitans rhizosphaerae]